MSLRTCFFVVGPALILSFGTPASGQGGYLAFGAGTWSCETWLKSPASDRLGSEWIAGFWSAWNAINPAGVRSVGRSTDSEGKIGEVRKLCRESPSMGLDEATMRTWADFRTRENKLSTGGDPKK